jgi:hypothetical protein
VKIYVTETSIFNDESFVVALSPRPVHLAAASLET